MTLSAKRKRDDTNDILHQANGLHDHKGAEHLTAASTEDAQANITDLIEILKG